MMISMGNNSIKKKARDRERKPLEIMARYKINMTDEVVIIAPQQN